MASLLKGLITEQLFLCTYLAANLSSRIYFHCNLLDKSKYRRLLMDCRHHHSCRDWENIVLKVNINHEYFHLVSEYVHHMCVTFLFVNLSLTVKTHDGSLRSQIDPSATLGVFSGHLKCQGNILSNAVVTILLTRCWSQYTRAAIWRSTLNQIITN